MRYLSPKNDVTFKKVFGEHAHLLKSFLNALLPLDGREIVELEYLPPELVPETPLHKNTIVDVRCRDNQGRIFLVEMQMLWTNAFTQRILFNATKAYVRQLPSGQEYKFLEPVYSLNLVDTVFDHKTDRYYHHYQIVNLENSEEKIEGLEFVLVELPKFRPTTLGQKRLQVLWLRFLTEINERLEQIPEELQESEEIREAVEVVQHSALSPAEREAYDKYWDIVQSERTLLAGAREEGRRIGLEKGEQIGLEKGAQIGLQKGEQIGLQKGEQRGVLKTALMLLRLKSDANVVKKATQLSDESISELQALLDEHGDQAEAHLTL